MVGGLILTFIIDLTVMIINFGTMWGEDKEDGGVEIGIRRFTVIMIIISLLVRFLLIPIYWKLSVDFSRVVMGKE